ncbi:MAG TPA: Crp/Fnr family transcriptional regulator [Thermoanaerobaculia bacterium]|nr:Crp/Fnr family transcriptional regulator [Thermoanaerobaculia bacterium]
MTTNRLLELLPEAERDALRPERMTVTHAYPLIVPSEPIKYVYFPINALGSLVTILEDGSTIESGSVGREGMVGVPVILGADTTPMQTVVQIPGDVWRVESEAVKRELAKQRTLHGLLNRYVHTIFVVASQSTACIRRHTVEARLARWLLMSSDGVDSHELPLTQEFLGTMLGVRRAGVTEAAAKLQGEELIRYSRGFVEIVDRPGLEAATCECYHNIRREYERLLGPM